MAFAVRETSNGTPIACDARRADGAAARRVRRPPIRRTQRNGLRHCADRCAPRSRRIGASRCACSTSARTASASARSGSSTRASSTAARSRSAAHAAARRTVVPVVHVRHRLGAADSFHTACWRQRPSLLVGTVRQQAWLVDCAVARAELPPQQADAALLANRTDA